MYFALRNHLFAVTFVAAAVPAVALVPWAAPALADGAFITQASKGAFSGQSVISTPINVPSQIPVVPPRGGTTQLTPETTLAASGGNVAGTLEMGRSNFVLQAQSGGGNSSNVGIIGGKYDKVGVFQHGQGLVSNLALLGVQGLTVDVLQPPGTAPVNMLIARLPNGAFDIIQPKGAPQASIVRVGNVLVVR
ncbi:MAG TPA: hypothetical protein VFL62_26345 [Bradyrhizobium sp.]|uniref:hypothetical protein n=1 Tax=Bradyrhizobium sp. TaxID=376 RepID=UPI002D7E88F9|nr:hypothetical protein [Bradyrhizobium sp.]HET7889767.1 hypothetical protein [Bradyrhizobium sp.]